MRLEASNLSGANPFPFYLTPLSFPPHGHLPPSSPQISSTQQSPPAPATGSQNVISVRQSELDALQTEQVAGENPCLTGLAPRVQGTLLRGSEKLPFRLSLKGIQGWGWQERTAPEEPVIQETPRCLWGHSWYTEINRKILETSSYLFAKYCRVSRAGQMQGNANLEIQAQAKNENWALNYLMW